eukprot:9480388-Pyramimonas_sp.AAC.1
MEEIEMTTPIHQIPTHVSLSEPPPFPLPLQLTEEIEVTKLLHQIDPKTKHPMKKKTPFVKSGSIVVCRIALALPCLVEKFSNYPQLGRFTLRDEGKTIAIGKVMALQTRATKPAHPSDAAGTSE